MAWVCSPEGEHPGNFLFRSFEGWTCKRVFPHYLFLKAPKDSFQGAWQDPELFLFDVQSYYCMPDGLNQSRLRNFWKRQCWSVSKCHLILKDGKMALMTEQ